jgi:Tfp pilus assembly protein PilF
MNRNALKRWIQGVVLSLFVLVLFSGRGLARDGGYYFQEGTRLLKQAKPHQAVASLTEAIRLVPDRAAAYNNRGLAYFELKKYAKAKQDFFTALQLSPDDQQANNNLGILFCDEKDYDQALVYFQKAVKDNSAPTPFDRIVYGNLSFVYLRKGMTEEASEAYEKTKDIGGGPSNNLNTRPYGKGTEDYNLTLGFSTISSKNK